ncbi:signal peptidase I [Allonocardiopsis opalescens]|uniref:Signal peptidase I n=1 Tax=Allonocardiopsis opalescens TaxID=1144618 RepID=A0A2T0Q0J9_9ACTN|nr:signal peptidase I [Allonocardiopsis opalescens]PRX97235.1 signal peptidase I [Allonocardiopsis opalescens]
MSDDSDSETRGGSGTPGAPGVSGDNDGSGTPGRSAATADADPPGGASADDADGGTDDTAEPTRRTRKKGSGSFWKELPILIAIALVLSFAIQTWVVRPYYVPSGSMENTLQIDDRVFVNKFIYRFTDIQRGDVIVFNGGDSWDEDTVVLPEEPLNPIAGFFNSVSQALGMAPTGRDYVKRVIGLPGDTVECCDVENRVLVNGVPLDEPYLYPGSLETHEEFGPVTVPEGRLWVLGDHRAVSYDSRGHSSDESSDGTISEASVLGQAFMIHWPLDRISMLERPATFDVLGPSASPAAAAPLVLGLALAVPIHLAGRRLWRRGD